jgi:hypothetical protein
VASKNRPKCSPTHAWSNLIRPWKKVDRSFETTNVICQNDKKSPNNLLLKFVREKSRPMFWNYTCNLHKIALKITQYGRPAHNALRSRSPKRSENWLNSSCRHVNMLFWLGPATPCASPPPRPYIFPIVLLLSITLLNVKWYDRHLLANAITSDFKVFSKRTFFCYGSNSTHVNIISLMDYLCFDTIVSLYFPNAKIIIYVMWEKKKGFFRLA